MLKLVGAVITVTAFGLTGMTIARKYREYPNQLRLIRSGLQMLETEIVYASSPMPEALEIVGRRIEEPIGDLFLTVASMMTKRKLSLREAWENGLEELRAKSLLEAVDIDILRVFGHGLGMSDVAEQVKNLHLVQEQLSNQELKAREKRDKGEKLWHALGFLLGLAVVLILY